MSAEYLLAFSFFDGFFSAAFLRSSLVGSGIVGFSGAMKISRFSLNWDFLFWNRAFVSIFLFLFLNL